MAAAKSKGNAGSLFYGMTLGTSDFSKKLKAMRKLTKLSGEAIRKSFKAIAAGGVLLAGAFAGITAALTLMTKGTAQATNDQFLLAKSIGATVTQMDGLAFTADAFNVSQDMLIDKMREAGGLDAFKGIADQVAGAGNATQQLAKAQELLGNEGLKLLPILQLGSDGLERMEEQALKTGNALPTDKVAALVTSWRSYESLMQTLSGLQRKLSAELALPVAKLFTGLDQIAQLLGGKLMSSAKTWATFINNAIPVIAKNVFSLTNGFITFGNDASQGIMLVSEALFGLEGGGNRSLSIFQLMGDLLATLPNQVFIVLKKVAALTLGTFQTIGNAFARALTEPMILAMNLADKLIRKLGGSGFTDLAGDTKKIRDTFSLDIGQNIKDLLDKGGLLDVTALEAENDRIILKRSQDEDEFVNKLKMSFGKIDFTFDKLKTEIASTGKAIKEAVSGLVSVNENRAGAVLSGSQEEFKILSGQSDKNLKVQMEIRDAIKKTNRIFANIGTT